MQRLYIIFTDSIYTSSLHNRKIKALKSDSRLFDFLSLTFYWGGFFLEILSIGKDELEEWEGRYNFLTDSSF